VENGRRIAKVFAKAGAFELILRRICANKNARALVPGVLA